MVFGTFIAYTNLLSMQGFKKIINHFHGYGNVETFNFQHKLKIFRMKVKWL